MGTRTNDASFRKGYATMSVHVSTECVCTVFVRKSGLKTRPIRHSMVPSLVSVPCQQSALGIVLGPRVVVSIRRTGEPGIEPVSAGLQGK